MSNFIHGDNLGFDIDRFAEVFKNTINWMLESEHAEMIKEHLQSFKEKKDTLERDKDSFEALETIIEILITNSWNWRFKKPTNFDDNIKSFKSRYGKNFRTEEAKGELIKMVVEWRKEKKKNIEQLFTYPTLREFTEKLYKLAKEGRTEVLGEKGRDNYLRDFGYWDRIPIDIHEKRFIIRSGIYHACSSIDKSDPSKKMDLHDALSIFCSKYLNDYRVEEINLGKAPGIVDIFIWSFSAEGGYNICGATPKCEPCKLKGGCLYALTSSP